LLRVAAQNRREQPRPASLGPLELSVTPVGPLDRATVDRYAELGVDRLVLLPQPDAGPDHVHIAVPADRILANIDWVAEQSTMHIEDHLDLCGVVEPVNDEANIPGRTQTCRESWRSWRRARRLSWFAPAPVR
jgi:hypothetical protein